MHAIILGSKEYPLGTADSSDTNPSGGMELYVEGLAGALARKGVKLTVMTRRFKGAKNSTNGGIRVVRMPFVPGFFLRNPTFNLMSFLRALSLDFDVIISNGEVANFFGLLLSKIRSRPVVMVSHGQASCQPQYNPVIRSVFRLADRLTYQNADAVVTHAPRQLAGLAKRYSVVMPGLDRLRLKRLPGPERRRLKARYAPSGEKIILFTGRLIAVKGVEYLLRSLRHVRQKHVCIIAGDGPDMEKLRRLAASERANVVFTGFSKDVSALLSIADVFALPSLSESLNYSLVEAAFMGVPIACTDIGIISSREAFLARPRDERSLADAISHALSAGNGKMLKRARKYAESFDWDATAEKYIRIMEGVLA